MIASARRPKEVPARDAVGPVWDAARKKELDSYKQHDVYGVVLENAVPHGTKVTPMRWVYLLRVSHVFRKHRLVYLETLKSKT